MKRYLGYLVYTVKAKDIGRPFMDIDGRLSGLGRVLPKDVDKQIYAHKGVLQLENDEQKEQRLKSE